MINIKCCLAQSAARNACARLGCPSHTLRRDGPPIPQIRWQAPQKLLRGTPHSSFQDRTLQRNGSIRCMDRHRRKRAGTSRQTRAGQSLDRCCRRSLQLLEPAARFQGWEHSHQCISQFASPAAMATCSIEASLPIDRSASSASTMDRCSLTTLGTALNDRWQSEWREHIKPGVQEDVQVESTHSEGGAGGEGVRGGASSECTLGRWQKQGILHGFASG